jgi:hypothetical protein
LAKGKTQTSKTKVSYFEKCFYQLKYENHIEVFLMRSQISKFCCQGFNKSSFCSKISILVKSFDLKTSFCLNERTDYAITRNDFIIVSALSMSVSKKVLKLDSNVMKNIFPANHFPSKYFALFKHLGLKNSIPGIGLLPFHSVKTVILL